MTDGTRVRVVLVTAPSADVGRALARSVVEAGLAACVNVVPGVTSVYRWDGAVQEDDEVLLVLKTTDTGVDALRGRVLELHPYDVPEFLVLPVTDGSRPYLDWVTAAVSAGEGT